MNGFVEHLEEYRIVGRIYATNVMDAGLVKNQSVFKDAYDMGYLIYWENQWDSKKAILPVHIGSHLSRSSHYGQHDHREWISVQTFYLLLEP